MSGLADELPQGRLEEEMGELKPALDPGAVMAEANRCLFCYDAPCIQACPTRIDIPGFIRKIATGNLKGSARTILEANVLGYSCGRVCPTEVLCEGACVYNHTGEPPIRIGQLQAHATRPVLASGERVFERGEPTGRTIGIVGGGPAGLACAHELARLGHESVIFEKRDLPGGLNTTGVAPYKMTADESIDEIDWLLDIGGIELRTGCAVGDDVPFETLDEYDAVFVGVGLGPDSFLDLPGMDLPGVIGACDLIERFKTGPRLDLAGVEDAVVVGGGNTAIDAVRELARVGVPSVTLVYRRSGEEMPAYDHEVDYAHKEGVRFEMQAQPTAVEPSPGPRDLPAWFHEDDDERTPVGGVRCVRTRLGEPGADGRRRPEPVPESTFRLRADLVVLATGQETLGGLIRGLGLELEDGRLPVDAETGMTTREGYFAGGDLANGGKEVVDAVAEGARAARGIDRWLRDGS